jgi:hypothetical protein
MVTAGSSAWRMQTITYSHQMQYATVTHDHRKLGLDEAATVSAARGMLTALGIESDVKAR